MYSGCVNVRFCVGGVSDRLSYTSDQEIAIPSTPTSRQPPPQRRSRTLQDHDNSQRSVTLKIVPSFVQILLQY